MAKSVIASQARGARGVRKAALREALFASTALVGVALAAPAMAQTANPAGGGTITTSNGTITGGGANQGVLVQQRGAGGVEVTGVSITNTGATPIVDGLRVVGAGGRGVGIGIVTTSTITSQSGDGVRLQGGNGENVGFGVTAGQTLNVTGINGVNITSTGGLFLSNPGDAGAIVATARTPGSGAGVRIATGAGFGGSLGNVTATNFATGIDLSGDGVGTTIEGRSITGAGTGIRADSTANIILDSRATIEGVNGIYATAANGALVTTSGTGTINARFPAIGAGITAISSGGTGAVTVNSGQAIGNSLAGYIGIDAQTLGTSTGAIAITTTGTIHATDRGISAVSVGGPTTITAGAAILGGNNGIYATSANGTTVTTNAGGTIDSEVAGNGIGINVTGTGLTQVTQGAAIGGTTTLNRGIVATATGAGTVNVASNAAITTAANGARGILVTTAGGAATVNTSAVIRTPGNGVTVNTGSGIATTTIGGAINISGTSGTGVEAYQVGAASVVNVNADITGGNRAVSARGTVNVATGVAVTTDVFAVDLSSTGTLNNRGSLTANYRTVGFNGTLNNFAGATITSTGSYVTSLNRAAVYAQSSGTIFNAGSITGTGPAYGVLVESGFLNLTNQSGGNIGGTAGAIFLNTTGAGILSLQSGSTVTGDILSQNSGTRTVTLAGSITGNYNAGSGTGVNTFTLASSGSMQGATFGNGNDTFNFQGGAIGGVVDGGAGSDTFNSNLGLGNSTTLNQSSVTNFDVYNQQSGNLTLIGSRTTGGGWNLQGGTLNFGVGVGSSATLILSGTVVAPSAETTLNVRAGSLLRSTASTTIENANGAFAINNAGTIDGTSGNTIQNGQTPLTLNNMTGGVISTSTNVAVLAGTNSRITNAGTITGGAGTSFGYGVQINGTGAQITNQSGGIIQSAATNPVRFENGGTLINQLGGLIQHTGIANDTRGAGVYSTGNLTLVNGGRITTTSTGASDGVTVIGVGTITNTGTRDGNGALTGGVIAGGGSLSFGYGVAFTNTGSVTNQAGGIVVGGLGGINGTSSVAISNAGTIGTGTVDASRAFVRGGAGAAITLAAGGTITNGSTAFTAAQNAASLINDTTVVNDAVAISATGGSLTIDNSGSITGQVATASGVGLSIVNRAGASITSNGNVDLAYVVDATASIINAGTMRAVNGFSATGVVGTGTGTITNAGTGVLRGGTDTIYGVFANAVQFGGAALTFNNYGLATSDSIDNQAAFYGDSGGAATINLFAGSTTGRIRTGSGNDMLALYNGRGTAGAATVDAATGITLQNAGTLAAASFSTIDLGGGTDTLMLRGTGDGSGPLGAAGTFSIATSTGAEILTKADTGTWTLTGPAITPGITINAGTGGAQDSGGLLIFSGTTSLTGPIYVNGGTIRANQIGAFGTGTIHAVDPTIQFAVGGTNTNNFVFDVAAPASADPTTFESVGANAITLAGSITTGTGNNVNGAAIAANQYVTFAGTAGSSFTLGSAANNWTGDATINGGITLIGTAASISGGVIVDNGALVYNQGTAGTVAKVISGTGTLTKQGASVLTLTAANTYTGTTTVSAGTLQLGAGVAASTSATSGVTIANGAILAFNQSASSTFAVPITGPGTISVAGLVSGGASNGNSLTLSGALTNIGNTVAAGGLIVSDASRVILSGGYTGAAILLSGAGHLTNLKTVNTTGAANGLQDGVRSNGSGFTLINGAAGEQVVSTITAGASGVINYGGAGTVSVTELAPVSTGGIQA